MAKQRILLSQTWLAGYLSGLIVQALDNSFHIPQNPHTRNVIHSIWQVEGVPSFDKECIVPKGVAEVIFNFSHGNEIYAQVGGRQGRIPACFINGFNKTPIQVVLPKRQLFFGVQFHPMAIKKIFGIPAGEFSDRVLDLRLIDPVFGSLWHQLAEQESFDSRVVVFSDWIATKLPHYQPQEKLVNDFLSSVDQHHLSVPELASVVCYSSRQLSRKMIEATGMNTEEVLHYKKYLHAVHLIHDTHLSLTQVAYQSNFSDQSHFIKSFRHYTNMTPGDYKDNKSFVKGHIFEDVR